MSIDLTYTRRDGTKAQVEVDEVIAEIKIPSTLPYKKENDVVHIDLTPLKNCSNLKELRLPSNYMESIDLSPISSCKKLEKLKIHGHYSSSIDLSHLSSCTKLQEFSVHGIILEKIDLTPLSTCRNLKTFNLREMNIQAVDISPLSTCKNLQDFSLQYGKFKKIDLTPLNNCTKLNSFSIVQCNELKSIDITPLSKCTKMEGFHIWWNDQLETMNLSPISSFPNLRKLLLADNKFQNIDLSLVSNCKNLQELRISGNEYTSINLEPLVTCKNLQEVRIGNKKLQSINLFPLIQCTNLQKLYLYNSSSQPVDVTFLSNDTKIDYYQSKSAPLFSWFYKKNAVYHRPKGNYDWSFLHQTVIKNEPDLRVQHDILAAMGLAEYGFVDCDLIHHFLSIPEGTHTKDARSQLADILVEEITKTIENKGATTGLALEELVGKDPRIAKQTKSILKQREEEMQNVRVFVSRNKYNMQELWVTAFGYKILSSLNRGLATDYKGYSQIKHAFAELGIELKTDRLTGRLSSPGQKMSWQLKEAIRWIGINTGRKWEEIAKS